MDDYDDADGGYEEDERMDEEDFEEVEEFNEEELNTLFAPEEKEEDLDNRVTKKIKIDPSLSATTKELPGEVEWKRHPYNPLPTPFRDEITLQHLEADYYIGKSLTFPDLPLPYGEKPISRSAIVRIFGVDREGHSIVIHVHNFMPYFYVPTWPSFTQNDLQAFAESLNNELAVSARGKSNTAAHDKQDMSNSDRRHVLTVVPVRCQSVWGYHFNEMHDFLKITVSIPALVATARRICENGLAIGMQGRKSFVTYESNLPYVLRCMVDCDIRGGGWMTIPAGKYRLRALDYGTAPKTSRCQLELDCDYRSIQAHESVGEFMTIAPLRVLSFDIECAGRKGHFPTADTDPVIQIACAIAQSRSMSLPSTRIVFTLNTCSPIAGVYVHSCMTEEELLSSFLRFVQLSDPDVITGYNIINFDLPYLLDRAKALRLSNFAYLGRITNNQTTMKNSKFESRAFGIRENKEIKIEGRVQMDLLDIIRKEYKLRSYTLNSVCMFFLNNQKEDVHHSIITDLQNGDEETRRRLAIYCLKDAYLPLQLMDKLLILINFIEMARVTGVPLTFLLTRGQQIKVVSQLYRKTRQHSLVVPVRSGKGMDETYEGATVIEPKKNYYTKPIATLDFASLYPSIMIAHNLCYTTLVTSKDDPRLKPSDYVVTPNRDVFVTTKVRRGILPEILFELLEARAHAKKLMKQEKDPFIASVLNGRQLALKISANSVYGFTGATVGQLPCLAISSSVTSFGRQMILQAKELVESQFGIANGYAHNADIIYGDTDSIMVNFGVDTVAEAMKLGAEAAKLVSATFLAPISLEFEKVYYPYLLMNKKRYAGLYWTDPDKWSKMDTKGIETVRRDNCSLVSNVISQCLQYILVEKNVSKSIEYVKKTISDLLMNRMDLSLLVISKSLGKSAHSEGYKNKQAHVELAERIRKRDPQSAPHVGDRVAYVIINSAKNMPAYMKAEDPIYVLENDLPIDTSYYVTKQLQQPLQRIFEPILTPEKLKSLFAGEHTRNIKLTAPQNSGIMKFAVKTRTCVGCKVPLAATEQIFCSHCESRADELYVKQVEKVRVHEDLYSRTWTQCQRCQGSLHLEVLCTSRDCPIFYRRKKVQKELTEAQIALEKLDF